MEDFKVDFAKLDDERPIGVTGLMRVKNDGAFVAASIDSCIDALDELVIVYDDSEDNTEEVIKRKREEYPDKIRIYYYEPRILSHNLSEKEIEELVKLPENSPQLLSNYYNWTMSKASYRYAFKIDADQIYFTSKLKHICDLYRSEEQSKIKLIEKLSYFYFKVLSKISVILPFFLNSFSSRFLLGRKQAQRVQTYIFKRILNDKIVASFSGLNIFYDGKIVVPLGKFSDGVQPPINGSGDHIFFKPNSQNRYVPWAQPEYHRVIEIMTPKDKMFFGGGFLWIHLNALRSQNYDINKNKYIGHTIAINKFLDQNFFVIEKNFRFRINQFMRPIIFQSLLADKNEIENNIEIINDKFI